jgi:hypothetical protein
MDVQVSLGKEMTWTRMPMIFQISFEKLNLKEAILIGHSTGGGEVTRYIGRHGSNRV